MATDVERLIARLEVSAAKYERDMARAAQRTAAETKRIETSFAQMNSRLGSLMSSTATVVSSGFSQIASTVAGALSAATLVSYADSWQQAANRIAAAGEVINGVGPRLEQLTNIALRSRTGLDATTELYVGLRRATEALEPSQAQLLKVTENVNKAFVVGGANAQTQAAGILQLTQALQSGVLQGDELRSLRENAPLIAQAIADSLNVPIGKLKELGEEGALTADVVFKALLRLGTNVETQFARTQATVEQALGNLRTSVIRFVGQLDQQEGITAGLAQGILTLGKNIDAIAPVALAAGAALLAAFLPATSAIAAAGTAFLLFGEQAQPVYDAIREIGTSASVAFQMAREAGGEAWAAISAAVSTAATTISSVLNGDVATGAADAFGMVLQVVKGVVNAVISVFVAAAETIKATWYAMGAGLTEAIVNAMNAVIQTIEAALGRIVGAINSVTGTVGIAAIPTPNLGRVANAYEGAGRAAADAYGRAFQALTRDYVGDAIGAVDGALERIRQRANQIVQDRAEVAREAARARGLGRSQDGSLDKPLKPLPGDKDGKGGGGGAAQSEFERELANLEKRITALDRERAALSLNAFEAAKAEAAFKLLDAAKQAGVTVSDELRGKIDQLATAYASAKVATDEAKKSQEAFASLQEFVGTNIASFFSDIISGGKNAERALMNITKRLADAALQAVLLGKGPLAALLGGGSGGGVIGALFSAIGLTPGRSLGGRVMAGQAYTVGENGRETFVPSQNGRIINARQGSRIGGSSYAPVYNIDARGADAGAVARIERSLAERDRTESLRFAAATRQRDVRGMRP